MTWLRGDLRKLVGPGEAGRLLRQHLRLVLAAALVWAVSYVGYIAGTYAAGGHSALGGPPLAFASLLSAAVLGGRLNRVRHDGPGRSA